MPNEKWEYIYKATVTLILGAFGYALLFGLITTRSEVLQGILSGIFTTGLLWLVNDVYLKIVLPWYKETTYTGAEISDTWESIVTYKNDEKNKLIYQLERSHTKVKGIAKCLEGNEINREWYLNGYFENSILTLTYHCLDKTKIDKGSITLMLINNGSTLEGHINYYSDKDHTIKSVAVEFTRKE